MRHSDAGLDPSMLSGLRLALERRPTGQTTGNETLPRQSEAGLKMPTTSGILCAARPTAVAELETVNITDFSAEPLCKVWQS